MASLLRQISALDPGGALSSRLPSSPFNIRWTRVVPVGRENLRCPRADGRTGETRKGKRRGSRPRNALKTDPVPAVGVHLRPAPRPGLHGRRSKRSFNTSQTGRGSRFVYGSETRAPGRRADCIPANARPAPGAVVQSHDPQNRVSSTPRAACRERDPNAGRVAVCSRRAYASTAPSNSYQNRGNSRVWCFFFFVSISPTRRIATRARACHIPRRGIGEINRTAQRRENRPAPGGEMDIQTIPSVPFTARVFHSVFSLLSLISTEQSFRCQLDARSRQNGGRAAAPRRRSLRTWYKY